MIKSLLTVCVVLMFLQAASCGDYEDVNNKLMQAGVTGSDLTQASQQFSEFVQACRAYFNRGRGSAYDLQIKAQRAETWVRHLASKYWSGFNSVILGRGQVVTGKNVYIMNPALGTFVNTPVTGNNVIRFKGFDLQFDQIHLIASNPRLAITRLNAW